MNIWERGGPPDEEAVIAALDAIVGDSPAMAHRYADDLLLSLVSEEVRAAYERLVERCEWWAYS